MRAGGVDDPDATRAAAVLGAYFRAEQARAIRRRVWRTAAVGALAVWVFNIVTSVLTPVDILFASVLTGGALIAVMVADLHARSRLHALLTDTERP